MAESIQNYPLSTDLATQEELDNAISSMDSISSDILDGLSNVINTKLSVIADLISAETEKLDTLSTSMSGYVTADSLSGFITEDSLSGYATVASLSTYATEDSMSAYATEDSLSGYENRISSLEFELSGVLSILQIINGTEEEEPTAFIPTSGMQAFLAVDGTQITSHPVPVMFGVNPDDPDWMSYTRSMSELTINSDGTNYYLDPSENNGQYNGILVKKFTYMPEPIAWFDSSYTIYPIQNSTNATVTWVEQ